jgi:flagellar hook assembly protein FlgD
VTLEVLDLAGQRVKLLESGALPAGEHVATWDGTDRRGARRAPGVYFVRLYDGTTAVSTKVVVAR